MYNVSDSNSSYGDNTIRKIIIVGLIIRELFSFWTGHYDFEVFVRVGYYVASGNNPYSYLRYVKSISFLPYDVMTSIGYPPFIALFAAFVYLVIDRLSLNRFFYYFLLKQPMILSDVAVCFLLYKLAKEKEKTNEKAIEVAKYWAFNPFIIIISSIWGMIDPLVIFFLLLSYYCFLQNTRTYNLLAGIFIGISVFIKQISLIYIPLMFIVRKKPLEYFFIPLFTTAILIMLPFSIFNWTYEGFYLCMWHQAFEKVSSSEIVLLPFPEFLMPFTRLLSIIWLPSLVFLYLFSFKLRDDLTVLIRHSILVTIIFLLTRISVSEQLFEYVLIFLLLYYATTSRGINFYKVLSSILFAYLASNNTLLIRFLSPLTIDAHSWDLYVNNTPPFDVIRFTIKSILFILVLTTCLDLTFYCFSKKKGDPLIITKLKAIKPNKTIIIFSGYLAVLSALYTLLLNYDSLIFVALILLTFLVVVLFRRTNTFREFLIVFIRLLFINFVATSIAIPLYEAIAGLTPLCGCDIITIHGVTLDDRTIFKVLLPMGFIGLLFLDEILLIMRSIAEYISLFKVKIYNSLFERSSRSDLC